MTKEKHGGYALCPTWWIWVGVWIRFYQLLNWEVGIDLRFGHSH